MTDSATPSVFSGPTRGLLYLFNGGDVLHGVSAVRAGARVAAVFMFREEPPAEGTEASEASSRFFYATTSKL